MTATLGMIPNEAIKYKCLIAKWYQAWELRQQGKTFKEIGEVMKISKSWVASMVSYINLKIKYQKQKRISNELISLIDKYSIKKF